MFNERWGACAFTLSIFVLRVYLKQGYAVVAYLLGLFYLNNIMLYLAPIDEPDEGQDQDSFLVQQPRDNDEYKGFQRKLSEMEFWKAIFSATLLAAFLSMFDAMNIEIYWPLLVCYFFMMTVFLCRVKIEHMIKYNYIPFEIGKKKYKKPAEGGVEDEVS